MAVKHLNDFNRTTLWTAAQKQNANQSSIELVNVIQELREMSDYNLQNRINIPKIITKRYEFGRRRIIMNWCLNNWTSTY
jgi:hypothetical protein